MDLQTTKLELIKLIANIDDPRVIQKFLKFLKSEETTHNNQVDLTEYERREIEMGIKQLDAGQRISLEDFLEKVS